VAPGVFGILLVRSASDSVRGADRAIHVAQQSEREVLRVGECKILGWCVE
jgi:hypothetical protein